jgi:hypothetical protein
MKINEVVTEGVLDYAKKFIPGTDANRERVGQKSTNELVKKAYNDWKLFVGKTGSTDLAAWATQYFADEEGNVPKLPTLPTDLSSANVLPYLTTLTQDFEYAEQTGQPPETDPINVTAPAPVTAPKDKVQIIQSNPTIVKFDKKQYTIGDNGQWVPIGQKGTKAPPIQSSLSALFDKALGRSPSSAAAPTSKPITVTTPTGINVTRGTNGRWIRSDNNTRVTDPTEIKGLNQLAINQRVIMQKKQGA